MLKIFVFCLVIFVKSEYISQNIQEFNIEPLISKKYSIDYFQRSKFIFSKIGNENEPLQVNIHSINCNIEIISKVNITNKKNFNTYSIKINPTHESIDIEPIFDMEYGEYKLNYEKIKCYLSLNSYFLHDSPQNLTIDNNEENILYFENSLSIINISYQLKDVSTDNFIALYCGFEESEFQIEVFHFVDNHIKELKKQTINNSTYIYLNSDLLFNKDESKKNNEENKVIFIYIQNKIEKKNIMYFKIIEKNSVCLLEKNALNFGFLTTNTDYQYYYTEVFKGEEGELMLHNKRFYGELYGKIIEKNEQDLTDISIYPNIFSEEPLLEYNQHYLRLKYNYTDTLNCFNGCYLLITYKQYKSEQQENDKSIVGYEFTILSRIWNYTDYISEIIDIPFNEFLIGCFEQDTTQNHYYSINIPNDADKIIIEIESNYLEFYYDEGKKKINTINRLDTTEHLNINNSNPDVFILDNKELNFAGKTISFALRPTNYYNNIFSFYYFSVLYFKEEGPKFYPINSYFGIKCKPEYNINNSNYFCNFIMKFNYNESKLKFSVTSVLEYNIFNLTVTKVFPNKTTFTERSEFIYVNDGNEDIDYLIFKFEYPNDNFKIIISSFEDEMKKVYSQIYSVQMFFIYNMEKLILFNYKYNNYLYYQYLYGPEAEINFLNLERPMNATKEFLEFPLIINIDDKFKNISSSSTEKYIFFYKLIYDNKINRMEELKLGKPRPLFFKDTDFPLDFYIKLNEQNDINVNFNLRLITGNNYDTENNIEIKGYLLEADKMQRKLNNEKIPYPNPIIGDYTNGYKIGFLQALENKFDKNNYLIIELDKTIQDTSNIYILLDILAREYNDNYFLLPKNKYLHENFNDINNKVRGSNRYMIDTKEIKIGEIIIELSPQYDYIDLEFENINDLTKYIAGGFKKYRIKEIENKTIINFKVLNNKAIPANYMIRYYEAMQQDDYYYSFNENVNTEIINSNYETSNFSLILDNLGINKHNLVNDNDLYFDITGILYKLNKDEDSNEPTEIVNTTSMLTQHIELQKSKARVYLNETKINLTFINFSNKNNVKCDLQLQVVVKNETNSFREKLVVFSTKVDLTDLKSEKVNEWIIIGVTLAGIILILVIVFIIKYLRLRSKTTDLIQEVNSLEYSNVAQKIAIIKEKTILNKKSDYETLFI